MLCAGDGRLQAAPPCWQSPSPTARVGRPETVRYTDDMPLYEYRCTGCGKRVTVLTLRVGEEVQPKCDRCGAAKLERLMSRFAMVRSEDARLDALSDPSSFGDLDEKDPKSMARWMKRVGGELGDELGGGELDEMVDSIESGADDADTCGAGSCDAGPCGDDSADDD